MRSSIGSGWQSLGSKSSKLYLLLKKEGNNLNLEKTFSVTNERKLVEEVFSIVIKNIRSVMEMVP